MVSISSQWLHLTLLICFIFPTVQMGFSNDSKKVGYESLWNLNEMTECKLHYTALDYNNYGCWCGVGGAGEPMDGIDNCCMHHDKCYDAAVDNGICFDTEIEYVDNYDWSCDGGEPKCQTSLAGCKAALCECDKTVVDCWSKYPKPTAKVKCTHCESLFDRMIAALRAIGAFLVSIPKAIIGFFT